MDWGPGYRRRIVLAALALAFACVFFGSPAAFAATAPHVATSPTTDTCAMCHRAHTAPGSFGRVTPDSWEMTSSALAVAVPSDTGDTQLCYVCHGFEALGSGTDVQSSFNATSAHTLAPVASPYGPSIKQCSSCHDSHGADEIATDTPFPKLLRSRTSTGVPVFQAEEYCTTCHQDRPLDTFDGLAVYRQTGHYTQLPDPANGTKVRCSICHVAHGSTIAPLIVSEITSPALTTTFTVPANDRRLCIGCHPNTLGTYAGPATYAVSGHGTSSAVSTIAGEWPATGSTQLVGECQTCHASMGRDDGTGNAIPKLADAAGRELCDRCHDADGPAATDIKSLGYPASAAADPELIVAVSPNAATAAFGRIALYGTEATSTVPRAVRGPREYRAAAAVGDMATGDIDGDGTVDVIVADPAVARVTVLIQDDLKGITSNFGPGVQAIAATAEFVAVADVFDDASNLPELLALDADAGNLYVYRWDGFGSLTLVDGPIAVGGTPTGIATGALTGSVGFADVIVTDASVPEYNLLTETAADTLTIVDTAATKAGPRGPSIGDVWPDAGTEIVIANSGDPVDSVSVFAADGTLLGDVSVDAAASGQAWDTLVVDVLWDSPIASDELAVAVYGADGLSSVNVFEQTVSGLAAPQRYDTGTGFGTGSLAAGDLDGDGHIELVAGDGGWWDRDDTKAHGPGVHVYNDVAGTTVTGTFFSGGGVERAGMPPAVAIADLGMVGYSRHPVSAVPDAHNSTETPPYAARHVECVDCHEVHEATSTAAVAPLVYGRLKGVFGSAITNTGAGTAITYGDAQPVTNEYEVCLKCHSAYSDLEGGRDIAAEVNPLNASVHAVEQAGSAVAQNGSFTGGWTNTSTLFCKDCHGTADAAAPVGTHSSAQAPILLKPYLGVSPADSGMLCYSCHKYSVYYTSVDDTSTTGSYFYNSAGTVPELHGLHVRVHGFGCASCHVSHGSPTEARLIRDDIGFVLPDAPDDGSCTNACHTGGAKHAYTR